MTTIREILKGIDQQEIDSPDGWWETSVGADFGAKKLAEVEAYHQKMLAMRSADDEIERLRAALGKATEMLRRLEFSVDTHEITGKDTIACPICGEGRIIGLDGEHRDGCDLAALLREFDS